ncbi:hypothetical protein [Amycolatopsis sacchari]|uniref:hypothetical protein n=1 Tax=Amycolatopsis sacchari TaxID=115433 RepID=UPI003D72C6AE
MSIVTAKPARMSTYSWNNPQVTALAAASAPHARRISALEALTHERFTALTAQLI